MTCERCGKELNGRSTLSVPTCRPCAIKITIKELLLNLALPLLGAFILYWIAGRVFEGNTNQLIFTAMLIGFLFGARRMFAWIIPFGHSVAATVGILLFNVLIGALIGWAILAYMVVSTSIKTIYRIVRILAYRPVQAV